MAAHADSRPLVVVAPLYAVSAVAYTRLPPWTDRGFIAFLLPTAAVVIYVLMRLLHARDHVRQGNGTFTDTYNAIVFRVVLFVGGLHGTVLAALLGRGLLARTGPLVPRLAPILLGAVLIAIGNLLPRVRPNVAIGIRTSRTLRDREAWLRTNRTAGYISVTLGFVIVATALLVPRGPWVSGIVGGMGLIAVVTLVARTWRDAHDRNETAG